MLQLSTEKAQVTQVDIAWAAGLFDGEGSIGIYSKANRRERASWELRVSISMAHKSTVREFARIVKTGTLLACPNRKPGYLPQWRWSTQGPRSEKTLKLLLPHLWTKREQAIVALAFRETFPEGYLQNQIRNDLGQVKMISQELWGVRAEFAAKIKQLKLVG